MRTHSAVLVSALFCLTVAPGIAFGAGLLAAGIAIATTGGNGNNAITTTTTSTSP